MTVTTYELKLELADALNQHITLLKDVEAIDELHMDAFTFMMRSLGFMLEKAPDVLITDNEEDLYFAMFQYYNLLAELQHNIQLSFSDSELHGKKLTELIEDFPTTYQTEMTSWWEKRTGLALIDTKQTMHFDN